MALELSSSSSYAGFFKDCNEEAVRAINMWPRAGCFQQAKPTIVVHNFNHALVLFPLDRASRINQTTTGLHDLGSPDKHLFLLLCQPRNVGWRKTPANLGVATQCPCTRTRRINHDLVETLGREGQRPGSVEDDGLD